MIYIKTNNSYLKYHVTRDGKFICTQADGSESVILYDVSDEFDGVISEDGREHFIIQGLNGELVYLNKENDTWKKYNIFKSRKGVRKISGIKLTLFRDMLCAFYIMEYTGKNLLIRHLFSVNDLYREPEVLNITDKRKDFCICQNLNGDTYLFFKNEKGKWANYVFSENPAHKDLSVFEIEDGASNLCAASVNNEIYLTYTAQRGNSTALLFCSEKNPNDVKTITFGISKNCRPKIVTYDEFTCIQWSENGGVMQADLLKGDIFNKPKPLGVPGAIAQIRELCASSLKCRSCAVYNMYPYIRGKSILKSKLNKGEPAVNFKNDIINDKYSKEILSKLNEIESDIDTMGKNLEDMCLFLSELQGFKHEIDNTEISIAKTEKKDALSGDDVGEIDENNIKIFESTDIDSVLPEQGR